MTRGRLELLFVVSHKNDVFIVSMHKLYACWVDLNVKDVLLIFFYRLLDGRYVLLS